MTANSIPPIDGPFLVGNAYTRNDIYELLGVPEEKRRGNWETGYNRWGDDLYIFSTVGSAATGGYDYNNRWEDGCFVWYAKEGTRLDQPQIQWMLHQASRVFIFTRPAVRHPFDFHGIGTPISWEDTSPVLIRWRISEEFVVLPSEEKNLVSYIEGAVREVSVNAYERNPKARKTCLEYHGYRCSVCGFDFAEVYGDIGRNFIHVHHLKELAAIGEEYEVCPIEDMRPVCPNCHAMLHVEKPAISIERLQSVIRERKSALPRINVPET